MADLIEDLKEEVNSLSSQIWEFIKNVPFEEFKHPKFTDNRIGDLITDDVKVGPKGRLVGLSPYKIHLYTHEEGEIEGFYNLTAIFKYLEEHDSK